MLKPQLEPVPFFYRFSTWCMWLLLTLFSRWRVVGRERMPMEGPLLVISNHQNNADPSILIGSLPRSVRFMSKQELFKGFVGWMSRWLDSFPVRRGEADRQAIKTALELLQRKWCVGMFPEGTRSRTGGLIQGYTGAGLVAVRSGAPVLPIAIVGSSALRSPWSVLRRPRIEVIIGEPFTVPLHQGSGKGSAAVEATEIMMRRIAALLPVSMRGVYGEQAAVSEVMSDGDRDVAQARAD